MKGNFCWILFFAFLSTPRLVHPMLESQTNALNLYCAINNNKSEVEIKQYLLLCPNKNKTNLSDPHLRLTRVLKKNNDYSVVYTYLPFYPLVVAIRRNKILALQTLLNGGCNVNITFPEIDNNNLLYFVRTPQIFKTLVKHKINVFHKNKCGNPAFTTILFFNTRDAFNKRNQKFCLQIDDRNAYPVLKEMVKAYGYESIPELKWMYPLTVMGAKDMEKAIAKEVAENKPTRVNKCEIRRNIVRKLIFYMHSQKTKDMGRSMVRLRDKFTDLVFEY